MTIKIIRKILNILTATYLIIAVAAFSFPKNFISEIVLSASVYIMMTGLLAILIYIILLLTTKEKATKTILAFFILLLWLTNFLYNWKIKDFSEINNENKGGEYSSWFTLLFSNILRTNKNTEAIEKKIQENNPDIIAFVEFSLYHKEKLYNILQEKYPYTNINKRSKTHAGNIIFSKFPIKDLSEQTNQWTWRYNYVKIKYQGNDYYLYIIHTSSPITPSTFRNRNQQLNLLAKEFQTQKQQRPQKSKVMMIWDFNITPRSYYYQEFSKKIELKNYLAKAPFEYTWSIQPFSFIWVLIDHFFISDTIKIEKIKTTQIQGSDHKWYVIKGIK